MRILIITSCTGQKAIKASKQLKCKDFAQGAKHIRAREAQLKDKLLPAQDLYTGQQHVRLMRGIQATESKFDVDLHIVSAGYGLVRSDRKLAPYECTFTGRSKDGLAEWADRLGIPRGFSRVIAEPYDLGLLLLGDDYLAACRLDDKVVLGGPTLALCGHNTATRLPQLSGLITVPLGNKEAKRFSCGLVGLKGEVAARLLQRLAEETSTVRTFTTPGADVLALVDSPPKKAIVRPSTARPNPAVDQVIKLPETWRSKPHREKLRYFIPEWDDLVDPDYDFERDIHSGGRGDWSNEVYAHQIYPEPNYDGILISRAVAEKSKKKNARINERGAHRYLRVPREFPIMGDCGAFDYIEQNEPPYTTEDVLDYYTRLDFDAGVSVDHLIVPAFYEHKQFRYELTINNAEEFIKEHRKRGLRWEPIGAVQGWGPKSYADAAAAYIRMGYRYIALGGLVRCQTKEIIEVLKEVTTVLRPNIRVHLFGIARPDALPIFASLGVTSVDSASHLRRAWLIARDNYFTLTGTSYSAIRIPEVGKSFRTKRMIQEGKGTEEELKALERRAMGAVLAVDRGAMSVADGVRIIEDYDRLIGEDRDSMHEEYRRTLEDKPWRKCPCEICQHWGVQVAVFRGNNRNRRRGFHNTYVFYRLMQKALAGEALSPLSEPQIDLFRAAAGS